MKEQTQVIADMTTTRLKKKEHLGGVEHNCIFLHNAQKQPFSQKEFDQTPLM
jgi:hypothetical protein